MPRAPRTAAETGTVPAQLAPQLATLVSAPPPDPEHWLFEIKFDGYRMLARVDGKDVRLISRNDKDWTDKLRPLQAELQRLRLPSGWYDGEIVVHDSNGRPDFGLLQNAFDRGKSDAIVLFLFDGPFLDGEDLRAQPLMVRRERLQQALAQRPSDKVRFSAALDAPPAQMIAAACQMGLEGIIGKRRDSAYSGRRSPDWIKLKCGQRQEFVIGGFTDPGGARTGIGALLLGTYDQRGALVYAGSVGTGFDDKTLRMLFKKLQPLRTDVNPFSPHRELRKQGNWVKPELVAEVSFAEWTHTGSIRHASFRGLRSDKAAADIVHERPVPAVSDSLVPTRSRWGKRKPAAETPAQQTPPLPDIKITNADRVIDAQSGATKGDLLRYYHQVSALMLPHLAGRPVSLVRAPTGVGGELFFQKHAETAKLPGVLRFPAAIHPGHAPMLDIASGEGLLSTAQWNVIEYHTQNAPGRDYQHPDRMIFDLDPGAGVTWQQIQQAAELVRAVLQHLGFHPFLKTSGGKGLHLDVPIEPRHGWTMVKDLSKAIVAHMAATLPQHFSAKSGAANRQGKIFIDYLRNGLGATTACAWSARARPGLGISVPVHWDELAALTGGDQWTIATAGQRLQMGNQPWKGYRDHAAAIDEALQMLEIARRKRRTAG